DLRVGAVVAVARRSGAGAVAIERAAPAVAGAVEELSVLARPQRRHRAARRLAVALRVAAASLGALGVVGARRRANGLRPGERQARVAVAAIGVARAAPDAEPGVAADDRSDARGPGAAIVERDAACIG